MLPVVLKLVRGMNGGILNSEINHNNEESPETNYMGWLFYEADGQGG